MAKGRKTGGRLKGTPNKSTAAIKAYAQQHDQEVIDFLIAVVRGQSRNVATDGQVVVQPDLEMDYRARVGAAKELLDRAHGRPAQEITGPDGQALVPASVTFLITKAPGADTHT